MLPLCRVLLLLVAGMPGLVAAAPMLQVSDGEASRRLSLDAILALAAQTTLEVHEPHEDQRRTYVGVPAAELLQALFGSRWRDAGSVLFECADGYRALVEPARLQHSRALLAFARADRAPFTLRNRLQNDEQVTLAPFYLVWDNLHDAALRAEGATAWPYQVVGIALVEPDRMLAATRPPGDGDDAVHRGHVAFRRHCLACHSVNGQGGAKGPELNRPVSVTEYLAPGWLRRWMLAPTSIRPQTAMPGLPADLPAREAVAADIEAYLAAMAAARRAMD